MAGRKKENFDRGRVEFKAEPEWIERAAKYGERVGMNLSTLIRVAVTQYLDQAGADRPQAKAIRRPKPRKKR
jgi:hypothetical protein